MIIWHCNIIFPYRIRKFIKNISTKILVSKEKKLRDGDEFVKTICGI